MKICILALSLMLQGCYLFTIPDGDVPVYKYNPLEQRYELTGRRSELIYNVFSREWEYVQR